MSVGRRGVILLLIIVAQWAVFEAGLRLSASSEAAPGFRALFMPDDRIGYRLRPGAQTHFATAEFETDIAINSSGVRDLPIGPKPPHERRIVILGDSLVMAVQVPLAQTFAKRLEDRLNASATPPARYRVINAGVQGYGPVEQLLFFERVVAAFEPDLVLATVFVGNDATEAAISEWRLTPTTERPAAAVSQEHATRLRRLLRASVVWQIVRLRLQTALTSLSGPVPERPLAVYLSDESPEIASGLVVTRECLANLDRLAAARHARTALVLMPARLQVDPEDESQLAEIVRRHGGTLIRDIATERFRTALSPLNLPTLDVLPVFRASASAGASASAKGPVGTNAGVSVGAGARLFYQQTMHLTPHGHEVLAAALDEFLRERGLLSATAPEHLPAAGR